MAKRTYADWLKAEQTNINPAGTPVIARPSATVGANYAALMLRNEQIRNTPESARGGYSALAPAVETVSATVPKLASDTPDWAKRTPTEQARVNAAQQNYATLAPATAPVSPYAVPASPYNYGAPKTETVQNTDAGSPSTGDTEPTFADYLALHPEYDEAKRQAEADYYRNRATYGANAERMAQAGIHGGYGEYADAMAYAQKQQDKANIDQAARQGYAAYLAKGGETATDEATQTLYGYLTSDDYYGLLNLNDASYNAQKAVLVTDLENRGFTKAQIEQAFAGVDKVRKDTKNLQIAETTDLVKKYASKEATADNILSAYGIELVKGIDAEGNKIDETDDQFAQRKTEDVRWALTQLKKDGLIGEDVLSDAVKKRLAIYDEGFSEKGWKEKGAGFYNSISTAIDDHKAGVMKDTDLQTVINEVVEGMGVKSISLDYNFHGDIHPNLELTLKGGTKLKADYNGRASDTVAAYLTKNYGNLPLVVYNGELYYQLPQDYEDRNTVESYDAKEAKGIKVSWYKLKTKKGSTGTPEEGNNYFATVAKIMMYYNNAEKMGKVFDAQNSSNRYRTWDIKTGKLTYSKK